MRKVIFGLTVLLCGSVHAAGVVYTDSSGAIRVNGYVDGGSGCYTDSVTAASGSLDAVAATVASGAPNSACGADLGATADGVLSSLSSSGFSISGTVSAFMQGATQPQNTLNDAQISRDVSFTLAEQTEVILDMTWSGCVDCVNDMYMGSYFSLREAGGPVIDSPFFEFISPNFSGAPGGFSNSYLLGPGDYQISMDINGQAYGAVNGSSGEYTASIGVTVVPLPAAAWLLTSALAGLAAFRRRRTPTEA